MKCEKCGKEHNGSYGSGRFCSAKCARSYSAVIGEHGTKIVQCIECGKNIEVDKRASAKSCKCDNCRKSRKYNKQTKKELKERRKNKPKKYCKNCGKRLDLRHQSAFCSSYCSHRFHFCKNVNLWLAGEKNGRKGKSSTAEWIKKYLIEIYGNKCAICGNTEWMGKPIPLILDHIDGHYYNNDIENLRLVCGNCDMQLDTYKSKNIGNGRPRGK